MNHLCDAARVWREASSRLRHDWLKNEMILALDYHLERSTAPISSSEMERMARWGTPLAEAYRLAVDASYTLSPARCFEHAAFASLSAEESDEIASLLDHNWETQFGIAEQAAKLRLDCAECILLFERSLFVYRAEPGKSDRLRESLKQLRTQIIAITSGLSAIDSGGRVIQLK